MKIKQLIVLVFVMVGMAYSARAEVTVTDAWVRPVVAGKNTALYMNIHNSGPHTASLVRAEVEGVREVQLHESFHEGEKTGMRPVPMIECLVGQVATLKPGGLHVMLLGVKDDLKVGDTPGVPVTLYFDDGQTVQLNVPIKKGACCHECAHDHHHGKHSH